MRWRRKRRGVFCYTLVGNGGAGGGRWTSMCDEWASGGGGAGGGGAAGASGAEEVLEEVAMPAVVVVGGGRRRWPMEPQLDLLGNPAAKCRPTTELFRFRLVGRFCTQIPTLYPVAPK